MKNRYYHQTNFIFTIFCFFLISCSENRKYSSVIPFNDSIDTCIINTALAFDTINLENYNLRDTINFKKEKIPILNEFKLEISLDFYLHNKSEILGFFDSTYLKKYASFIKLNNNKFVESPYFNSYNLKSSSFLQLKRLTSYFAFSKPYLSTNGKFVLLEVDYHCFGMCSYGKSYILKLKDGKWVVEKDFLRWIS